MAGGVLLSAQNDIACDEFNMKCDVAVSVSECPLTWPVRFFASHRTTLRVVSSQRNVMSPLALAKGL